MVSQFGEQQHLLGINLISFFLFYKLFIDKMKSDGREMQDAAAGGAINAFHRPRL